MMNTVALPFNSEGERRGVWSRESCLRGKEEKRVKGEERDQTHSITNQFAIASVTSSPTSQCAARATASRLLVTNQTFSWLSINGSAPVQ